MAIVSEVLYRLRSKDGLCCYNTSKYGGIDSKPNVRAPNALFRFHTTRK